MRQYTTAKAPGLTVLRRHARADEPIPLRTIGEPQRCELPVSYGYGPRGSRPSRRRALGRCWIESRARYSETAVATRFARCLGPPDLIETASVLG